MSGKFPEKIPEIVGIKTQVETLNRQFFGLVYI